MRLLLVSKGREVTNVGTRNEAERTAWLARVLREIPAGSRILDAGAGEQRLRRYCAHLEYVSQDFGRYDGKGDARGLHTQAWDQTGLDIVSDIAQIPEPDGSFDAIVCVEVFEHLPNPILALREFSRLLKVGGRLVVTAPFCSLTHFAPYHFYTGFNRYFYEKHLPESGFTLQELVENGNFFEYLAQEVRRIPSVAERYCGTRPNRIQTALCRGLIWLLGRLSDRDTGSAELLHFGCFVTATKNGQRDAC